VAIFERVSDGVRRGAAITIVVDGAPVQAFEGESVATALLAAGWVAVRRTVRFDSPRGLFCAMGVCFECLVTIDGVGRVRSCMTTVRQGMAIDTHVDSGATRGSV
jgi:predicted molibdopterin-dependent oxidoreductase YjgC